MLYQEFGQQNLDLELLPIAGQAAQGSDLSVEENIDQKLQQFEDFGQDYEDLTVAGQAVLAGEIPVGDKIGEELQQLEADLLIANKLLKEHNNKQERNNVNFLEQIGQSAKLIGDVMKITLAINELKERRRQIELQKTLNEILRKQKTGAKKMKKKKRKALLEILKEDKAINKRIRMDASISSYSAESSEKSMGFQVDQLAPAANMRRQLPPELLNEIYKNLPISNQCRMLTVNISTNSLLGGQNAVKKKWLKWKQVFSLVMCNCHELFPKSLSRLEYGSFARAFFKRKIQIEWRSYKKDLDENIAWFYQQFKKPSLNRITEMKCCRRRKNNLNIFKKAFVHEESMLEFLSNICSPQFECPKKLKKQLCLIRRGLPELIRPRKAQFDLVKAEVGNKLELADDLYAKLEKADRETESSREQLVYQQMRQIPYYESERNRMMSPVPDSISNSIDNGEKYVLYQTFYNNDE